MTATPAPEPPSHVFKICSRDEWQNAVAAGRYAGSADDARDGFIHLSTREQLKGTAAKHFAGQTGLICIAFAAADLGVELKWEPSRGGALFPHLYRPLDPSEALQIFNLPLDGDGVPQIPDFGIAFDLAQNNDGV